MKVSVCPISDNRTLIKLKLNDSMKYISIITYDELKKSGHDIDSFEDFIKNCIDDKKYKTEYYKTRYYLHIDYNMVNDSCDNIILKLYCNKTYHDCNETCESSCSLPMYEYYKTILGDNYNKCIGVITQNEKTYNKYH